MYTVYGIPDCDTTKKAILWLKKNNIDFHFHNYKTQEITAEKLAFWNKQIGLKKFFNKKSTTWRNLEKSRKDKIINEKEAIILMTEHTNIIKRPVIEDAENIVAVGFEDSNYKIIFAGK